MDIRNAYGLATRSIVLFAATLLTAACGGGGGGDNGGTSAVPETATVPTTGTLPETPSISWAGALSQPQSRTVSLSVMVPPSKGGLKQVDFFVDGLLIGTSTTGINQPGVLARLFYVSWNTATYEDGPHTVAARVTDNSGLTAETPIRIITLENNVTLPVALSAQQLFPTPSSPATGAGQLSINLATGAIGGDVLLTNMTATAVHLHSAWPTLSGAELLTLVFSPSTSRWTLPANSKLTELQVRDLLLTGRLYLDAHSTAYPNGELRAQVLSKSMSLVFGTLNGSKAVPPIASPGTGIVSVFENRETQRFEIRARTAGMSDVAQILVLRAPGTATMDNLLYPLRPDTNGDLIVNQALSTPGYNSGTWYMNVTTASRLSGEIGGFLPVIDYSELAQLAF